MRKEPCGRVIRIKAFGDLSVYRRAWEEPGLPKFVIFSEVTGNRVEEFTTKNAALRYAEKNGKPTPTVTL